MCGEVIYDNHMRVPLISEFELQHFKKEEGEALVLAGRNFPCVVNLADIDEYPMGEESKDVPVETPCVEGSGISAEGKFSEVPVFSMEKENNTAKYFCKSTRVMGKVEFTSQQVWLVGVCNGIIMTDDCMQMKEVYTGKGIMRLCLNEFKDVQDALNMDWYTADESVYILYDKKKKYNPENVFLSIEELGMEHFEKVPKVICTRLRGVFK